MSLDVSSLCAQQFAFHSDLLSLLDRDQRSWLMLQVRNILAEVKTMPANFTVRQIAQMPPLRARQDAALLKRHLQDVEMSVSFMSDCISVNVTLALRLLNDNKSAQLKDNRGGTFRTGFVKA